MIAVCPSCHDSIHHGRLRVSDELLYEWKEIPRRLTPEAAHIYVEPAPKQILKLLTGTIALSTVNDHQIVFELSNNNPLKLRVLDGDILHLSSRLHDQTGKEVLRVVENHVKVKRDSDVSFDAQPGEIMITVPATEKFIPRWVIERMRVQEPNYAEDGRIIALRLRVQKPGVVRVEGCWPTDTSAIVITPERMAFCDVGRPGPISFAGAGEDSVLMFAGTVTRALFGFQQRI